MSDVLGPDGLQLQTLTDLRNQLISDLETIYGTDINVDQNSPDGQQVNISAQYGVDIREVLSQVFTGFDPDQASGRVLDQRAGINGVERQAGTFTRTPITITVDRALNLVGLDTQADVLEPTVPNLYTVRDDENNQYFLLASVSFVAPGSQELAFRAARLGQVEVQLNTITTAVTVIAGVTNVNNPSAATIIGVDEESDANLRARRRGTLALGARGSIDSIRSALNTVPDVTTVLVVENNTNTTDADGTPGNTIWAIVEGGTNLNVATAIYLTKPPGTGMRGAQVVAVPTPEGATYPVRFDRPGNQDLFIRFSIVDVTGAAIDATAIATSIVENVFWAIGEAASIDVVVAFLKSLNENYRITGAQLSADNSTFAEVVNVSSPQNRFINDVARITIV